MKCKHCNSSVTLLRKTCFKINVEFPCSCCGKSISLFHSPISLSLSILLSFVFFIIVFFCVYKNDLLLCFLAGFIWIIFSVIIRFFLSSNKLQLSKTPASIIDYFLLIIHTGTLVLFLPLIFKPFFLIIFLTLFILGNWLLGIGLGELHKKKKN